MAEKFAYFLHLFQTHSERVICCLYETFTIQTKRIHRRKQNLKIEAKIISVHSPSNFECIYDATFTCFVEHPKTLSVPRIQAAVKASAASHFLYANLKNSRLWFTRQQLFIEIFSHKNHVNQLPKLKQRLCS